MLLQELRRYADEQMALPPPMYQEQPVRYIIQLTEDGRMMGPPIDTADVGEQAGQTGRWRRSIKRVNVHAAEAPGGQRGICPGILAMETDDARIELGASNSTMLSSRSSSSLRRLKTGEPAVASGGSFLWTSWTLTALEHSRDGFDRVCDTNVSS